MGRVESLQECIDDIGRHSLRQESYNLAYTNRERSLIDDEFLWVQGSQDTFGLGSPGVILELANYDGPTRCVHIAHVRVSGLSFDRLKVTVTKLDVFADLLDETYPKLQLEQPVETKNIPSVALLLLHKRKTQFFAAYFSIAVLEIAELASPDNDDDVVVLQLDLLVLLGEGS